MLGEENTLRAIQPDPHPPRCAFVYDLQRMGKLGGDLMVFSMKPAEPRRFPSPWRAVERNACFVVEDANPQPMAYVYYEDELGASEFDQPPDEQ